MLGKSHPITIWTAVYLAYSRYFIKNEPNSCHKLSLVLWSIPYHSIDKHDRVGFRSLCVAAACANLLEKEHPAQNIFKGLCHRKSHSQPRLSVAELDFFDFKAVHRQPLQPLDGNCVLKMSSFVSSMTRE